MTCRHHGRGATRPSGLAHVSHDKVCRAATTDDAMHLLLHQGPPHVRIVVPIMGAPHRMAILVVDDHHGSAHALAGLLRREGTPS